MESCEIEHITILHVSNQYNEEQAQTINTVLYEQGIHRPLFWVYNVYFANYFASRKKECLVFVATEDYFSHDSYIRFEKDSPLYRAQLACLDMADLLIAVSDGVHESYLTHTGYKGRSIVIPNGCDYTFYNQAPAIVPNENKKIVFYQGNIFNKLHYELLIDLVQVLPEWSFHFCGRIVFNEPLWQQLCAFKNVHYLGLLTSEQIRTESYRSTVGIIPFRDEDWLSKRSLPLKAFEYLACGIPVVSSPIDALKPYATVFSFATTVQEYKQYIEAAAFSRHDPDAIMQRKAIAKMQDYDLKFEQAMQAIYAVHKTPRIPQALMKKRLVLIIMDSNDRSNDFFNTLSLYSHHEFCYETNLLDKKTPSFFSAFDAIFISDQLQELPVSYLDALKKTGSLHVVFSLHDRIQLKQWMNTILATQRPFNVLQSTVDARYETIHQLDSFLSVSSSHASHGIMHAITVEKKILYPDPITLFDFKKITLAAQPAPSNTYNALALHLLQRIASFITQHRIIHQSLAWCTPPRLKLYVKKIRAGS